MTAAMPRRRQHWQANERLREAVFNARLTPDQLARVVEVDPKTVQRWIGQGRTPYPVHQHSVAVAVGVPERELWPTPRQQIQQFRESRQADQFAQTRPSQTTTTQSEIGGEPLGRHRDEAISTDTARSDRMRELMSWAPTTGASSALADYRPGNALADALARQAERDGFDR